MTCGVVVMSSNRGTGARNSDVMTNDEREKDQLNEGWSWSWEEDVFKCARQMES